MQWSAEENAGFSTGKPWQEMTEGWEEKNVELASLDSDSLLNWYRGV